MRFFARREKLLTFALAAALLVACSGDNGELESGSTPANATPKVVEIVAEIPTALPTASPLPTVTLTPMVKKDLLLPFFFPFPPKPIPSRPPDLNPLTGLSADPASLQRRPILVRIGNDEKVRSSLWQAGLTQADVVFEELIDQLGNGYANTRYTAVFLSKDPPLIGPVRSGRIVNFQIAPMLDGALSHAGASNGTRWLFSQTPMINLDEFFNMPAYCYMKSHGYQGRLYTTGPRLREWLQKKNLEKAIPLFGFPFSDAVPAGQEVKSISLLKPPWPKWAQVEWRYDAASAQYNRFVTGVQLVDNSYSVTAKWGNGADCVTTGKSTQTPVRAANVVVLYAKHEKTNIVEDTNNAVSVHIYLTDQGDARFFRDGVMIQGKWQRQLEQEFFQFVDKSGNPVSLKPGTTWFEIVPTGYTLDLK